MNLEVKTNEYIESLYWRYATKKFNSNRKISSADLEALLTSIQLSASSYGLQPYEVLVVENEEIRKKLRDAGFNQSQITDASHLLVFVNYRELKKKHISNYIENISETRNKTLKDLDDFQSTLEDTILSKSVEEQQKWASKQAYIALGNLLSAAASFRIDACPMEGFEKDKFDEILGLKEMNLMSTVIVAVGYRSEDDQLQHLEKVRKSKSELFHFI